MAHAQSESSHRGQESVVAGDARAYPGAGAGHAGEARADLAPRAHAAHGALEEKAAILALDGALRHPEGAGQAGVAQVGAPDPHPGPVAEVDVPMGRDVHRAYFLRHGHSPR